MPDTATHIEITATVNMAVIEFIYWLLGETGQGMGADGVIEAFYVDSQKGKKSLLYKALNNAIEVLLPNGIITCFPDTWERSFARWIGRHIINNMVKNPEPLSSMDRYEPSKNTRKKAFDWVDNAIQKKNITLVTGHTHISDHISNDNVELFNLGGWLIDGKGLEPDTNVLLIDEENIELKKVE